ncbi:MAG: glycosyltransferase family 2 protein [Actinomycetota bacterium]
MTDPVAEAPMVATVIVNFDSGSHLANCLAALGAAQGEGSVELLVVDNASTDGSVDGLAEAHPEVRFVYNARNLGYGSACNIGSRRVSAPFLCFLNPDVVPAPGSLLAMAGALVADPKIGVLGPRLNNPDGSLYPSCRVFPGWRVAIGHAIFGLLTPSNRFTRAYQLRDMSHSEPAEVDWVSGAAMMVRREAFEQVGGFDERYFMYVEDVDLCSRLRRAGWEARYFPAAQMMHHVAGSSRRTPYRMIFHHHRSLLRYALSRTGGAKRLALPLIAAGLAARMVLVWMDFFLRHGRKGR